MKPWPNGANRFVINIEETGPVQKTILVADDEILLLVVSIVLSTRVVDLSLNSPMKSNEEVNEGEHNGTDLSCSSRKRTHVSSSD